MGSVSTWMGDRLGIPSVVGSFFGFLPHMVPPVDHHALPTGAKQQRSCRGSTMHIRVQEKRQRKDLIFLQ